jgi:hypothetical protein
MTPNPAQLGPHGACAGESWWTGKRPIVGGQGFGRDGRRTIAMAQDRECSAVQECSGGEQCRRSVQEAGSVAMRETVQSSAGVPALSCPPAVLHCGECFPHLSIKPAPTETTRQSRGVVKISVQSESNAQA